MPILTPEDHQFFDEQGYLVIKNIIPPADCEAVVDTIFDFLEMDRQNPDDWYRLPLKPGGMIEMYQHQTMWNNRQNPRLYQALTEIRKTEKLWVSIDRVGFKPPQHPAHPEFDHKGFTHWDVDTTKRPIPFGIQGVLCLTDTDADMGGFQCIPGFHNGLEEWLDTQPADRNPYQPDMTHLTVVPIVAKQGDFVIWNSRLAHGNGHNVSQKPRFSQYISMVPAKEHEEEQRQHRIDCWRNRLPPGGKTFPGDPREIEQKRYQTAELTPLGRKLLGLDSWEDASPEEK
ncbi:MAG: Protein involved in biosynthesis of mitomycin antibiotics/polyketide fumonisin [Chthonomonadales bacterium]|nr:Protein involved in biosynthesis of mitomycin antibiotics/polyketide fumonisin [Chthonomonadales bacterium]